MMSANQNAFRRWGENETRVFVKLYLGHQCLWDRNHDQYKSKFARESAYNDIISKFVGLAGILLDSEALKRKINNLRSTYCQELKRISERSTPEKEYKPSLSWFQEFHKCFSLQSKYNVDETKHEMAESIDDTLKEIWFNQSYGNTKDSLEEPSTNSDDTSTQEDSYIVYVKTEPDDREDIKKETTSLKYTQRFKTQRNISNDNTKLESKKKKLNNSKNSASELQEDEFDIYGKFIASQLREIGWAKAVRVQLNIQKIVSDARTGHLIDYG